MTEVLENALPTSAAGPQPALRRLAPLVGDWLISGPGGLSGRVSYQWTGGGGFLVQQVELLQNGVRTSGVEYIGHDKGRDALCSHYFGGGGELLEYVYELAGDTLTIWFGEVGSPAKFSGTFSDDGRVNTGAWSWPGGGYASTMTRVDV